MTADVSIIIPSRGDGRGLARAIRSVRGQVGVSTQIVVVLDCPEASAVEDRNALSDLRARDQIIGTSSFGRPGPLRNLGIAAATGRYIAFLDDDDEWLPTKLQRQLDVIRSADCVLVSTDATMVTGGVDGPNYHHGPRPRHRLELSDLTRSNLVITSSALVRADAIRRVGGFPTDASVRFCDDYIAWLKLLTIGSGSFVDSPLVRYSRHGPGSLSRMDRLSGREVRGLALSRLVDEADAMGLPLGRRARRRILRQVVQDKLSVNE
ncbi:MULTISPECIES: glycosyltransferase family 2 protein [unclassified Nocardioides]|uniref:glycosyltransferase family 2 protein n=1 Tax=unclassified Nocardioides TaxID=2615069 RepID=UPI000A268B9D|nr:MULTISPECIES: glycosyltransferase family A protein [unclassified Nocardioides]